MFYPCGGMPPHTIYTRVYPTIAEHYLTIAIALDVGEGMRLECCVSKPDCSTVVFENKQRENLASAVASAKDTRRQGRGSTKYTVTGGHS